MKVIGTAGHVDHGKSTLVRAITGVDPDRLEEEQRRGMTIDLGFAWLTLPSGAEASIVDVPGHERFIRNMLAGAGGVDIALLVVAADEAVMPQTREHVDILNLLGVGRGVVALTKSDLVDGEWLDLAKDEVRDLLADTTLADSPIVAVSGVTGEGLDALLCAIDREIAASGDRADGGRPYLPVDRSFSVAGFGTVVTGTLHDGSLSLGEEVEIMPSGVRARIRSMQTHRKDVTKSAAGGRVALNLSGIHRNQAGRGDIVSLPGLVSVTRRFDARLRVLKSSPVPLSHGAEVTLHAGSAEVAARVSVVAGSAIVPGEQGWAQFRTKLPLACVPRQRFIVRLPAPVGTVGGGEIVDLASRTRRSSADRAERLAELASGSPERSVPAALHGSRPRSIPEMRTSLGLGPDELREVLETLTDRGDVVVLGESYLKASVWREIAVQAEKTTTAFHDAHPLRPGIPTDELRSRLGVTRGVWPSVQARLVAEGVVERKGPVLAVPGRQPGAALASQDVARVRTRLAAAGFSPPAGSTLLEHLGVDRELLEAMAREGQIVRVDENLYFESGVYEEMVRRTVGLIRSKGHLSVGQLRDELRTSRKYVLAFLEHLDAERVTSRRGEVRVLGSRGSVCA